jgi:hypothetical protein
MEKPVAMIGLLGSGKAHQEVKQMADNQTRLLDAFRDMHVKRSLPMDDFEELARKIMYGGAHTVTKPDQKSKAKNKMRANLTLHMNQMKKR